jgi:transcriptional regulator with XRE-family HTH domain
VDNIKSKLGKNIQKIRKSRKITQDKMAEIIGIETTNFSKIETGKNYPTAENLQKIADALNVDVQELFAFEDISNQDIIKKIHKRLDLIKDNRKKLLEFYNILKAIEE